MYTTYHGLRMCQASATKKLPGDSRELRDLRSFSHTYVEPFRFRICSESVREPFGDFVRSLRAIVHGDEYHGATIAFREVECY